MTVLVFGGTGFIGQRAIRRFSTDPVPQQAIEQVLAAAARAPSGGNRQQWSFIVIRDDALKQRGPGVGI